MRHNLLQEEVRKAGQYTNRATTGAHIKVRF